MLSLYRDERRGNSENHEKYESRIRRLIGTMFTGMK